jgi:hypothetical protein
MKASKVDKFFEVTRRPLGILNIIVVAGRWLLPFFLMERSGKTYWEIQATATNLLPMDGIPNLIVWTIIGLLAAWGCLIHKD